MILMYHKVYPESPTMWWVEADAFRRQMLNLRSRRVVRLDEYDPNDAQQVVITFDGVYRNVMTFAAPVLADLGYPFELFVTGDYVGRDNVFDTVEPRAEFADERCLSRLVSMGGRLQWHGNAHINLGDISDAETIETELAIPESLRRLDPQGFRWFAYPHGTFNDAVLASVRKQFSGALSCHQGNDSDHHCLNRVTVTNETNFEQATVSVIIPCYNYGTYLAEAVESVLRQTFPPKEILISDDASTDDTPLVMDLLTKRYGDRLRMHRNQSNMGIVNHFNQAVSLTSGDYVCFLGADNRFRSDYLEHTVGRLDQFLDAAIAYSDFALFGPRAPIISAQLRSSFKTRLHAEYFHIVEFPDFTEDTRKLLLEKQNFIHGSSLFRRKAFEQVGGYVKSDKPEDWNLFQRMILAGWSATRCAQPLLEYRQHSRDQANVKVVNESELHHYREGYRYLLNEIESMKNEVARLKNTISWRITAPLRVLQRFGRKAYLMAKRSLG
jgi:glycosyltransferase involved in cell wall biosynthesis